MEKAEQDLIGFDREKYESFYWSQPPVEMAATTNLSFYIFCHLFGKLLLMRVVMRDYGPQT